MQRAKLLKEKTPEDLEKSVNSWIIKKESITKIINFKIIDIHAYILEGYYYLLIFYTLN